MKWVTSDDREIPIKELEQDHLENIFGMLNRWKTTSFMGQGLSETQQALIRDYYQPIKNEIKRRLGKEYNQIQQNYNI